MENKIVALVNGKEITKMDLDESIARFPRDKQNYLLTEEGQKQLLEQMIAFELISEDAKENGLENDKEYLVQLEKLKKEVLTQVAINKLLADVEISDDEICEFYEKNKHMFVDEESVGASHILVDSIDKINEISSEIEKGLTFEEAARKYSTCPSKAQGGNLGIFTRGKMVPEFEEAAFALEVGKVSEPVMTQFGYHLIKVGEKHPASAKPLDSVKNLIKNQLTQEKQTQKYAQYVNDLKQRYNVEIK